MLKRDDSYGFSLEEVKQREDLHPLRINERGGAVIKSCGQFRCVHNHHRGLARPHHSGRLQGKIGTGKSKQAYGPRRKIIHRYSQ